MKELITERLKEHRKEFIKVQRRFERYDNHEDLELLAEIEAKIEELNWVLERV